MGEVVPRYTCSLDSHVIHEKNVSLSDMSSGKNTWYDKYQNPTVLDASTQNFPTPRRNPSQKTMVFSNPKISPIQAHPIVSCLFQRSTAFQLQLLNSIPEGASAAANSSNGVGPGPSEIDWTTANCAASHVENVAGSLSICWLRR